MVWDSTDLRNRNHPNIKDTAFLYGAGNTIEVEGEKLHWIDDTQDYGFNEGIGTAGVRGYQLGIFTGPDGSIVYQTGGVWILDLPNRGAMARL